MRDGGTSTWTGYEPSLEAAEILPPAPGDALSDPSVKELLPGGLVLWPRGAAWGTPDGMAAPADSNLANFTRALLAAFVPLYARLYALTSESRALTLIDSLADWEADFGLPDDCGGFDETISGRRRSLLSKVRSTATITPADFVRLARQEGFEIEIEEPATFECGFSECGGLHRVGPAVEEVYWRVHVFNLSIEYFTIGESETGYDRLFNVVGADRLECLFERARPAWTMPVFVTYDSDTQAGLLLDGRRSGLAVAFAGDDAQRRVPEVEEENYSGPVSGLVSFSRPTIATYYDADGILRTAAVNELRTDHDPLTGEPRGALIEAEGTNLSPSSETFIPSVGVASCSKTAVAPDGTNNATIVTENGTPGLHYVSDHGTPVTIGETYTWSTFAKAGTGNRLLRLLLASAVTSSATFDLSAGAWVAGSGFVSRGFQALPNGWYRVWVTGSAHATGTLIFRLQLFAAGNVETYQGDISSGIILWGRHLVRDARPGSYIATLSTPVSRAADALSFELPQDMHELTYTFDDGSALAVPGVSGSVAVPTDLPRPHVRSVAATAA